MYDAIVIGGGIVGTATAYHLVRGGARTLLLDRHDRGRATDAGAGILSAETYRGGSEAWFQFALDAAGYYPELVAALASFADTDLGYSACAKVTVAVEETELDGFERAKRSVLERQRRGGRPPVDELYEISPAAAHEIFPLLAPVRGALYFTRSARVDGRRLTAAMRRAALAEGLSEKQVGVDELIVQNGSVSGVVVGGERVEARNVVIAGGAWSPSFERQLRMRIPVEPQRGQLVHLRVTDADTGEWPIVEDLHGHYIVPWPDGRVVAGATRETGSGFDVEPSDAGLAEVLHEAFRLIPALRDAEMIETRVGLRPLCVDRMPVLGPAPHLSGAFLATGHGATGLQLGPYSGKMVADTILGIGTPDIAAFHASRFPSA